MENHKEMWENEQWLEEARSLLNWAEGIESLYPIALLVRHSHRLHSENQQELLHMPLTNLGCNMAIQFGTRIPEERKVDVFYSEHPRCQETAFKIIEGAEKKNISIIDCGNVRELLGPFVETSIGPELKEYGIDGFINRWGKGEFPLEQIEPLGEYVKRLWNHITERMSRTNRSTLFLNVTHDLVLMSLRRGILGIEASNSNWTPFLGGFGILKLGNRWFWYEKDKVHLLNEKSD